MNCTIQGAKTKALISFAVTAKLICVFVFAYADCWFSHEAAHLLHDIRLIIYALFINEEHIRYTPWSCQKVIEGVAYILENILYSVRNKVFDVVGNNCVPLVADLCSVFCYERDFMKSPSDSNQVNIF